MPFIEIANNPLMEMVNTYPLLDIFEKILGISTIISMIFIVNSKVDLFNSFKEKIYLIISIILLIGYYLGWIFYFSGYQSLYFVLITLVGFPPLYYMFIGLWRKNYLVVIIGILFLFVHIANVWTSY